jgi:hypothetical protein
MHIFRNRRAAERWLALHATGPCSVRLRNNVKLMYWPSPEVQEAAPLPKRGGRVVSGGRVESTRR